MAEACRIPKYIIYAVCIVDNLIMTSWAGSNQNQIKVKKYSLLCLLYLQG